MAGIGDEIERAIPHLRRFARALVKGHDPRDADDLVQETIVAALRDEPKHGVDLTTCCLSTLIRLHRHRNAAGWPRGGTGTVDLVGEGGQARNAVVVSAPSRTAAALDALPLHCREVLLLVVVEGLGYAQVAGLLDMPVDGVLARLTEARAGLAVASAGGADLGSPAQLCGRASRPNHLRVVK